MIGKRYRSTGISLRYGGDRNLAWSGYLNFFDDGWGADDPAAGEISTVGELSTRYFVATEAHQQSMRLVTDTLVRDAEALGIEFQDPMLYAHEDGEDLDYPMPEGWAELLGEQAERLGWGMPPYKVDR